MDRTKTFDLHAVSEARPHLLGLAALGVALFHSYSLDFFASPLLNRLHLVGVLNRVREAGNCGVDIFLFLSGLGLYFSMEALRERGTPHPVRAFYARRFARVLPPVLIVSILYYGLTGTEGPADWAGKVFLYGSFLPRQQVIGYWYFALLMLLYLAYPLIDRLHRKGGTPAMAGAVLLWVILTFVVRGLFPEWFNRTEIMLTRVPVFLLGVLFAPYCRGHAEIPHWIPWLGIPLFITGVFLVSLIPPELRFLRRFAYAPLALALILGDSAVCGRMRRKGPAYRGLCLLGSFSMEMYLLYENLYVMDPPLFRSADPVGITYALTVFTAALVLSAGLKGAVQTLGKALENAAQKAS